MKIRSITNTEKIITWNLSPFIMKKNEYACKSKIQWEIGQILQKKYPYDKIYEDVVIPETKMSLDFFLPQRNIAVEVQGSQHEKFSSFFHESQTDFYNQLDRDEQKKFFCSLNNITLLTFSNLAEAKEHFKC